jgi:hypothetical protein
MDAFKRNKAAHDERSKPVDWQRGVEVIRNVQKEILKVLPSLNSKSREMHRKRVQNLISWFLQLKEDKKGSLLPMGHEIITIWLKKGYKLIIDVIDTINAISKNPLLLPMFLGCGVGIKEWLLNLYITQYTLTGDKIIGNYYHILEKKCPKNVIYRTRNEIENRIKNNEMFVLFKRFTNFIRISVVDLKFEPLDL